MNTRTGRHVLILGYGNLGRRDDGLGPLIASRIEALALPGVSVDADYQLNIEDAVALASQDAVVFVDASMDTPEPYAFTKTGPATEITFTTHSVSPESVLAICDESFGECPQAWILAVRGYDFEFEEGLTPKARENLEQAVAFLQSWIEAY